MRVIIAGGTGLLGRALTHSLLTDGHEVVVLTRNPARAPVRQLTGATIVQWDAKSAAGWANWADGAKAIVNLAGEGISSGRWTPARKKAIVQSRVDAGSAVVEAVQNAQRRPEVVVQASAVGYYGPRQDERPVTEDDPQGSDWLARTAGTWEKTTKQVWELGVRHAVARTGVVFSLEGGAFPRMKLPFDLLLAGGPLGNGRQILPWIHLDDEARALRFLIEDDRAEGAFNLCAPDAATYRRFATTMGEVMGRPSFMPTPAFALKAVFGEMSQVLLTGQNQVPKRLMELGFTFKYPELCGALRAILGK